MNNNILKELLHTSGFSEEEIEQLNLEKLAVFTKAVASQCIDIMEDTKVGSSSEEWDKSLNCACTDIQTYFDI